MHRQTRWANGRGPLRRHRGLLRSAKFGEKLMSMVARLLLAAAALTAAADWTTAQAAWQENILINFSSDAPAKGYNPRLGVLLNGGNIYGVTAAGGKNGG